MNAAETIQAAIEKLTQQRADADYSIVNGWLVEGASTSTYLGAGVSLPDATPLTNDQIMVTLYATIDAQIAILQEAIEYRNRLQRDGIDFTEVEGAAVHRLARAILGNQDTDD